MEAVAVIVVIIVLSVILGVKPIMLAFAAAVVVGLMMAAMILLFFFFFIKLLSSRRAEAEFSRIDTKPNGKFKVAFYTIDGTEYPNVFPEEGILEKSLYKTGRKYRVYLNKKGYVFDRFAVATCTLGTLISIGILTAAAYFAFIIL